MASTAELIRKENEALKKARETHRARIKKLEESEYKRILKLLKNVQFFETEFSDVELEAGFRKMVELKQTPSQPGEKNSLESATTMSSVT